MWRLSLLKWLALIFFVMFEISFAMKDPLSCGFDIWRHKVVEDVGVEFNEDAAIVRGRGFVIGRLGQGVRGKVGHHKVTLRY